MRDDGTVLARCGAQFTPRPTLKVVGLPPGTLVNGDVTLQGSPLDPEQVCPQCRDGGR